MRGFLRMVLGTVVTVAVVGVALRATGVWKWIDAQITVQFEGPTGRAGRIAAWTMPIIFRPLYAAMAKTLVLKPEDEVLDVACGSGVFLRRHASHVQRIAGLDHSAIQIDRALQENRDRVAAGTAQFVVGDVAALPWADDEFSVVTSNCVPCFGEKMQPALEEMFRVLRPGGRAVVSEDFEQMMQAAGFSQVSVEPVGWRVFGDHQLRWESVTRGVKA